MILIVLSVLAALLVILAIVAALRSPEFRVVRTVAISAPAPIVFDQVNDLRKWEAWSPWAKLDPKMKQTYTERTAGVGASQAWEGNSKVGAGRMTITESQPCARIGFRLEFLKPFAATNTAEFTFTAQGAQTVVTWSMLGENNFVCRVVGLFMNMDQMVGGQFAQGLEQLKRLTETPAR